MCHDSNAYRTWARFLLLYILFVSLFDQGFGPRELKHKPFVLDQKLCTYCAIPKLFVPVSLVCAGTKNFEGALKVKQILIRH